MMAQAYAPGMAPNHPGMGAHAHPMSAMQAGAGHPMAVPAGPGMMQGIHPGVSAPQVTQGPMVTGMPPGPGTPAPGGPMQNPMAMAHLGPQQHMFPQQANPQMFTAGGMPMTQQMMLQQRLRLQQQHAAAAAAGAAGGGGMPIGMPAGMHQFSQAQIAQMKMNGMHLNPQMQMQAHQNAQQNMAAQQHQVQLMQHAQAQARQQAAMAAQTQRQVSQGHNMQMSRSQEQPMSQPPQPHPTPAPQNQPPPSQLTPQSQPPSTQPSKAVVPPPPPTTQPPNQSSAQVKQADEESEVSIKPESSSSNSNNNNATTTNNNNNNSNNNNSNNSTTANPATTTAAGPSATTATASNNNTNTTNTNTNNHPANSQANNPANANNAANNAMMMQAMPKEQIYTNAKNNAILQLILFQNSLANPSNPRELSCWDHMVRKFFSPFGTLKHQFVKPEAGQDKTFLLQYPSLARYLHAHFLSGIKQILLQSYEYSSGQASEVLVSCRHASLTYVFNNDVRISTQGSLTVSFDETNKITRLEISAQDWKEYLPRSVLVPTSPDMTKDGKPKMSKKSQLQNNKANQTPHLVPVRKVGEFGVPQKILGWLEIVEVMNSMCALIEYCNSHNSIGPREGMNRLNQEYAQNFASASQAARLQNQMARQANGQIAFQPGMAAMNGPNQFSSPAMAHLGLPQSQGSPHHPGSVHTPSPAQNAAGGVPMVPQMSAQGSMSGSQGASTNTSPNVTNKRRRASQIKLEDDSAAQAGGGSGGDNAAKVKASPRITKRQKGA